MLRKIAAELHEAGLDVTVDDSATPLGKYDPCVHTCCALFQTPIFDETTRWMFDFCDFRKIREAQLAQFNYSVVIGDKACRIVVCRAKPIHHNPFLHCRKLRREG